jgi:hypothetical protein
MVCGIFAANSHGDGAYIRSSVSDCKASERHEAEEINDYYDEHHASLPKSATLLIQALKVLAPEQRGRPADRALPA